MDALTAASTPTLESPGRYVLSVPDGWQQGRGAFGGLVLAALVRAIELSEPDSDRKVRSVNAEIAGPVLPGEAAIHVRELRRGNGLSCWDADMSQQGQGLVRASAVLARARSTGSSVTPAPGNADPPRLHIARPSPPPWTEIEPLPFDGVSFVPVFTQHIEFRTSGPLPFSGGTEPSTAGWVRWKSPPPALGAPEIVALADAFWPAALTTSPVPRPVATVSFALQHFPPHAPLDPKIPLYYRANIVAEQDGYMVEMRELWSPEGQLLALNQQTIAWIR